MAEIFKISIVRDARLFAILETHSETLISSRFKEPCQEAKEVLWHSILGMVEELEQNIHEDQTYARLVDFGHTFSPLLESASGFQMTHGGAVAVDIALSCVIASELGCIEDREVTRILCTMNRAGLPLYCPLLTRDLCEAAINDAVQHRGGMLNLVVPTFVGRATFVRRRECLSTALVGDALSKLQRFALSLTVRPIVSV